MQRSAQSAAARDCAMPNSGAMSRYPLLACPPEIAPAVFHASVSAGATGPEHAQTLFAVLFRHGQGCRRGLGAEEHAHKHGVTRVFERRLRVAQPVRQDGRSPVRYGIRAFVGLAALYDHAGDDKTLRFHPTKLPADLAAPRMSKMIERIRKHPRNIVSRAVPICERPICHRPAIRALPSQDSIPVEYGTGRYLSRFHFRPGTAMMLPARLSISNEVMPLGYLGGRRRKAA